jgi:hypothetical protein
MRAFSTATWHRTTGIRKLDPLVPVPGREFLPRGSSGLGRGKPAAGGRVRWPPLGPRRSGSPGPREPRAPRAPRAPRPRVPYLGRPATDTGSGAPTGRPPTSRPLGGRVAPAQVPAARAGGAGGGQQEAEPRATCRDSPGAAPRGGRGRARPGPAAVARRVPGRCSELGRISNIFGNQGRKRL